MESAPASQTRDLFSGGGDVLLEVRAVEVKGALQPLGKQRRRLPPERRRNLRRVRVEVADVDRLLVRRPGDAPESSGAGRANHQLDKLEMADRFETADVEDLAV